MAAAPQLSVASYKPDAVNQVQPRGISMMVSGETGVPYGTMMPQLATLQIGNSVSENFKHIYNINSSIHTHLLKLFYCFLFLNSIKKNKKYNFIETLFH